LSAVSREYLWQIVSHIGSLWTVISSDALNSYLLDVYKFEWNGLVPEFYYLGMSEVSYADDERLFLDFIFESSWIVDNSGVQRVKATGVEFNTVGPFFTAPVVLFYFSESYVVIDEHLGPKLQIRRLHPIEVRNGGLHVGRCERFGYLGLGKGFRVSTGSPIRRSWPNWGTAEGSDLKV